jgi:phosphatidylglycerophosphate synthase
LCSATHGALMARFYVIETADEQPEDLRALRRDTAWHLLFALLALVALGLGLERSLSLGRFYPVKIVSIYGVGAVLVLTGLRWHRPWSRFGPANQVTLARLVLTVLVGGLFAEQGAPVAWTAVIAAALAVSLDGVDGWLARRSGMVSSFGARFDMEVDAFLILVLALLAWRLDKAGGWVILAGVLRYGFVAAGRYWSWLRRRLPPSRRRKAVCVVQIVTLVLCLVPWVRNPWSDAVAAAGLGFLCYSFWVDIAWLKQHRHTATQEERA